MDLDYDRVRTRKRFENIRGSSRVGSEGLRDLPGWVGLGQEGGGIQVYSFMHGLFDGL